MTTWTDATTIDTSWSGESNPSTSWVKSSTNNTAWSEDTITYGSNFNFNEVGIKFNEINLRFNGTVTEAGKDLLYTVQSRPDTAWA